MTVEPRYNRAARIAGRGLVAIVRATDSTSAAQSGADLLERDVGVLEVALTTPGALSVIERLSDLYENSLVGAGTVLDAASARAALLAGASFLVSPSLSAEVVAVGHTYGAPVLVGAQTPTEIVAALAAGADLIKLFPAGALGPGYLEAISAALPQAPVVPTGGVDATNAAGWLAAGAVALGVGKALTDDPSQLSAIDALLRAHRARSS